MAAVEVQCVGCGETLEVDHGTTEFACPDCATAQRLPPELMPPPPPRPRRAIPLPPAGGRAAAAMAHDRLLCVCCGAMLSIPPDLGSFACPICGEAGRRPQAAARLAALAVAQPLPPEPEVLKDPQSHAEQVHLERFKAPICTDPSQGRHPTYSSYRDEPFSSLSGDKRVSVHGAAALGESYNTSGHVHNSERSPLPRTTTDANKRL